MNLKFIIFIALFLLISFTSIAQDKIVDEEAYKRWRGYSSEAMSQDGRWVIYKYYYIDNDEKNDEIDSYQLYDHKTRKEVVLKGISNPRFVNGGKWLTYSEKINGKKIDILLRLRDKKRVIWNEKFSYSFQDTKEPLISYSPEKGKNLVFKNLDNNRKYTYENVGRQILYNNGENILYIRNGEDSNDLLYGRLETPSKHKLIFSDKTKKLNGFTYNRTRGNSGSFHLKYGDNGNRKIYSFDLKNGEISLILDTKVISLDNNRYLDRSSFSFNDRNLRYITFDVFESKSVRKPKKDESKRDKSFELELWSWNDSITASVQAHGFSKSRVEPIKYFYDLKTGMLGAIDIDRSSSIHISKKNGSTYAISIDTEPYIRNKDWQHDDRMDIYYVDMSTGKKSLIIENTTHSPEWSPNGEYIIFYDSSTLSWKIVEPAKSAIRDISSGIDYPTYNEYHDKPNPVDGYEMAWSECGDKVIIGDKYDLWILDVTGKTAPKCYTGGKGRENKIIYRLLNPDYDDLKIDLSKPQELKIIDSKDMQSGYATLYPNGKIVQHIKTQHNYRILDISKDKKTYTIMRQGYAEDRNIWISDSKFKNLVRISDTNPWIKEYSWGSVELVEWVNGFGDKNRGLLYLPENYKKGESYPTIVNFYETHTGEMNIFNQPSLSNAMLNLPTYISRGYIVFMPDVHFEIGKPGESSYKCVVTGVEELIKQGIIDKERIGLQGHSWSGYQTSYLITQTDLFKCVNIGAPITNLTSAYVGVREESGSPRMFMYEDWQCRMGATLWDRLDDYIRNTPILYADKINTPTLIFHCDKDGAVSFSEGRNMFLALRRLQKPAWMLNYKGEGHFVFARPAMIDWTKRMQQFFDYYLKNTPIPRWMHEGINIDERGFDQKYDFVE